MVSLVSFYNNVFYLIETLWECFHSEDLAVHLRKLEPNKTGSLDPFAFVRWYVDEEVSMDSTEEAENLVGWGCKIILMDIQREIFLRVNSLKRERDQGMISLKEGSSLQPLRKVRSSTAQLQHTGE